MLALVTLGGLAILGLLVLVGRRPARATPLMRLGNAVLAAMLAVAAVVTALKGGWIASLALVVVSAFIGRGAGVGGARANPPPRQARREDLTVKEARDLLGVGEGAGRAEIEAAYRRLMLRVHPDHGGTDALAARLNAARSRLLNQA